MFFTQALALLQSNDLVSSFFKYKCLNIYLALERGGGGGRSKYQIYLLV